MCGLCVGALDQLMLGRLKNICEAVGGFGSELLHRTFLLDLSRLPRNPPFVVVVLCVLNLGLAFEFCFGVGFGCKKCENNKRLAWPQQPNLYLEPKLLRWHSF